MKIFYTQKSILDLKSLPQADQRRIADKMRFFSAADNPMKFAERLTDPSLGQFRFRIGNYRVIFDVEGDEIFVLKIARRDKVYK